MATITTRAALILLFGSLLSLEATAQAPAGESPMLLVNGNDPPDFPGVPADRRYDPAPAANPGDYGMEVGVRVSGLGAGGRDRSDPAPGFRA